MKCRAITFEEIAAGISGGLFKKLLCIKNHGVYARPGVVGEKVTTLTINQENGELFEEVSGAEVMDPKAWVITQLIKGPNGWVKNQYIIHSGEEELLRKYTLGENYPPDKILGNFYLPKAVSGPKEVFLVEENLEFPFPPSWGQEGLFRLQKSGVLVENGDGAYYGINPVEFLATHTLL